MLQRFYLTLCCAFGAVCAIGTLSTSLGAVLIWLLVWGLSVIAALVFYVVQNSEQTLIYGRLPVQSARHQ